MDGILLIDKPKDWTSFDVVAKVRGIIRTSQKIEDERAIILQTAGELTTPRPKVRVGHTGTLDPKATGLLVLCVGKYTKKVDEMIRHDKTYEVELTLGSTSTTGDQEGVITKSGKQNVVSDEELQKVLNSFVGEQMQTPPAFSAIKINGTRAYDLARAGKDVKIEPRKITIHSIQLTTYNFPLVKFICSVSSGTYIRSLATDIGDKLGCGAYMSELRRTKVGNYDITNALKAEEVNIETIREKLLVISTL